MDSLYFGWQWLRSNLAAIAAVALLLGLFIGLSIATSGPPERLEGTIAGFPLLGQKSGGVRVLVRLADGQTIAAQMPVGGGCVVGTRVSVLSSGSMFVHRYEIEPRGCEARPPKVRT